MNERTRVIQGFTTNWPLLRAREFKFARWAEDRQECPNYHEVALMHREKYDGLLNDLVEKDQQIYNLRQDLAALRADRRKYKDALVDATKKLKRKRHSRK